MYHIKDKGKFLCGKKMHNVPYISFTAAERATLERCCTLCLSEYNKIIGKLNDTLKNG
jgi:hypothetical protein